MGIIAGSWAIVTYFLGCHSSFAGCPRFAPGPPGLQGTLAAALAALLILASFVAFVGPPILFYVGSLLCLLIDALEVVNYSSIAPGSLYLSLVLITVALVLDIAAARHKTSVSEQSHPMNLPVFG